MKEQNRKTISSVYLKWQGTFIVTLSNGNWSMGSFFPGSSVTSKRKPRAIMRNEQIVPSKRQFLISLVSFNSFSSSLGTETKMGLELLFTYWDFSKSKSSKDAHKVNESYNIAEFQSWYIIKILEEKTKDTIKKRKLQANIADGHRYKNLQLKY